MGSANENVTLQPPLWREKLAIGALVVSSFGTRGTETGGSAASFCGGGSAGLRGGGRILRGAVEEDVVDHLVEIDRHLLVLDGVGHLADEAARALCDLHEVLAGLQQLPGEGAREHRIRIGIVVGEAIERGLPRACREHREHAFRQLRHRRKAAAAGDRAGAATLERIVAAGVEHQDRGARLLVLQPLDDAVGENGSVAHQFFLAFGRGRHVGRQQKVLARDLETVAGVEEERGVAGLDRPVEREQRLGKLLPVLVFGDHHGEAELLQRIAHGAGVVDRLQEFWNVLVVVVADDERDALFGMCGTRETAEAGRQAKGRQNSKNPTRHRDIPVAERLPVGSMRNLTPLM